MDQEGTSVTGVRSDMRRLSLATGATLGMLAGAIAGSAAAGELLLFDRPGFHGDRMVVTRDVRNLSDVRHWNDRARSLVVESGAWEICRDSRYRGTCITLRPGEQIADLRDLGMRDAISSVREVDEVAFGDRWRERGERDRFDEQTYRSNLSACQSRVYDGLSERFGVRGAAEFNGDRDAGTVEFDGRRWRYDCDRDGQIHIWQG